MNKVLFLVLIIGGSVGGGIMQAIGSSSSHLTELLFFAWIPSLVSAITWMVVVYKMWSAIQGEHARTTPGKAVGFLFIPFFNIYWFWVVFVGFAQDFNKYIQAKNPNATPLNINLFMAQVILFYCAVIPFVGILAVLAAVIISWINLMKICDGVNSLAPQDPYAAATA